MSRCLAEGERGGGGEAELYINVEEEDGEEDGEEAVTVMGRTVWEDGEGSGSVGRFSGAEVITVLVQINIYMN